MSWLYIAALALDVLFLVAGIIAVLYSKRIVEWTSNWGMRLIGMFSNEVRPDSTIEKVNLAQQKAFSLWVLRIFGTVWTIVAAFILYALLR